MDYVKRMIDDYLAGESTIKIGEKYGKHYSVVRRILLNNGIVLRNNKTNSRKYSVNENTFEEIDTEEKAYWLGFLYADGYVSSSNGKKVGLAISTVDIKHIEKYNQFLKSTYPVKIYSSSGYSNNEYCRVVIQSDKVYEDLVSNGVFEHKSNILQYPTWMDDNLQRHFIRGYVDGDGCITKNGNSYALKIMGTNDFLDGLLEYLQKEGVVFRYKKEKRKENCDVLSLNLFGKSAYLTIRLLYEESKIFLDRKCDLASSAINYFSRLYQ